MKGGGREKGILLKICKYDIPSVSKYIKDTVVFYTPQSFSQGSPTGAL